MQKLQSTKPVSSKSIQRNWVLFDVQNKVLGRVASDIAVTLMGKRKRNYVPNLDMGDTVVVINAEKVKVTGKKEDSKVYGNYSGYPGGLKERTLREVRERKPDAIIRLAVSGMLPKNKLRDQRLARLFIFKDENHPYQDRITK